ncbi:MAG TPA: hypothetical protein VG649_08895 [Candidatus Angelobacter sp.]|jgi:hypothetical protein|nr:hypothetical protein [Candidatus Angelobacter sp.]
MERTNPCPHLVVDKFGHCENCFEVAVDCLKAIKTFKPTKEAEKGLYYLATYADSDSHGVMGCEHRHQTIYSATACISKAGGYVVAVENGEERSLTDLEEAQFQAAMSGKIDSKRRAALDQLILLLMVKLGLQRIC